MRAGRWYLKADHRESAKEETGAEENKKTALSKHSAARLGQQDGRATAPSALSEARISKQAHSHTTFTPPHPVVLASGTTHSLVRRPKSGAINHRHATENKRRRHEAPLRRAAFRKIRTAHASSSGAGPTRGRGSGNGNYLLNHTFRVREHV